jgi:hypothetical protein
MAPEEDVGVAAAGGVALPVVPDEQPTVPVTKAAQNAITRSSLFGRTRRP